MGLCLGYGILQIPELILLIMQKLKKYFLKLCRKRDNIEPLPLPIVVQETQSNNDTDSNSQLNNDEVLQSLKIQLTKLTEKVDNLTERINGNFTEIELSTKTSLGDGSEI